MVQAAIAAAGGDEEIALRQLAGMAIELRRENVAVIGDHEAFIRRTRDGELLQIVRPVRLSVKDDTLWQMPKRRPKMDDRGQHVLDHKKKWVWESVPINPEVAKITADGLLRIDEVVGSSKAVQITEETGPPMRVTFDVRLVAAAPDTGNPVCVQYTHVEEAEHVIFELLGKFAVDSPESCYPCTRREAEAEARKGWRFWAEYGDEGYFCDMRHSTYLDLRKKFTEVLKYTRRKGYTIALRNAMKKHPAFGGRTTFKVDANGECVIGVKGWAGKPEAVATMLDIQKRLANGLPLPEDVGVIDGNIIDDDTDREFAPGDEPELAATLDAIDAEEQALSEEEQERNALIAYIDKAIGYLSQDAAAALDYDPANNTIDELRTIKAHADKAAASEEG